MIQADIIKGCSILIEPNKGISLEEQYTLLNATKIRQKDHKFLSYIELVTLAKKNILAVLGRKNVTPRDLKKAIINIIVL